MVKNKVVITEKIPKRSIYKEEIQALPQQKPNRKTFGIYPIRLGFYNVANSKRENKFRWWLKNKVGEPPVVFDEDRMDRSVLGIKNYMFNKGFLPNEVEAKFKEKNQKVIVTYSVIPDNRFFIGEIVFPNPDNLLYRTILLTEKESLLKKGNPFDINVMDLERKRISDFLRNAGYYYFNKEYLAFDLDSNQTDRTIKIIMTVNEPKNPLEHIKYDIGNIYVYPDYLIDGSSTQLELDTITEGEYHFIYHELKFKPKVLINGIHFSKGERFKLDDYRNTIRKFGNFETFKFIDIEIRDMTEIKFGKPELDVHIYLTPAKKQSISIDVELNQSFQNNTNFTAAQRNQAFTGTALSFTYRNKNLSKGADILEFKVSTSVEFQFVRDLPPLNNADFIAETNYYLNRFLVPFKLKNVAKSSNVRTRFSFRYNFGRRIPFYSLHSNTFTFGYEWNETNFKRHIYNPIYINLLLIPQKEPLFEERLENIPSLARSFEEIIVVGSNYTYLHSNKQGDKDRKFFLFRGEVRTSGNLTHALSLLGNIGNDNTKPYTIGNVPYSQFVRLETDFSYHFQFAPHASLVSRINTGGIFSYGNVDFAPFFQQFFAGGPNSIRGFRLRALGPGTYADIENLDNPRFFFDQAGDIKIELNTELRFDIYKWFKGAVFADAGNIWLLRDDVDRPGGQFKADFMRAFALSAGFGLRLDFNYFVIRTDLAMPIRDPRFIGTNNEWAIRNFSLFDRDWRRQNLILNLAIGYPF